MKNYLWSVFKIIAYIAIIVFFLFPIIWIFSMSFQTNDTILQKVPSIFFTPTLKNYIGLWEGEIAIEGFATMYVFFKQNWWWKSWISFFIFIKFNTKNF